jgi:hypothetical protein
MGTSRVLVACGPVDSQSFWAGALRRVGPSGPNDLLKPADVTLVNPTRCQLAPHLAMTRGPPLEILVDASEWPGQVVSALMSATCLGAVVPFLAFDVGAQPSSQRLGGLVLRVKVQSVLGAGPDLVASGAGSVVPAGRDAMNAVAFNHLHDLVLPIAALVDSAHAASYAVSLATGIKTLLGFSELVLLGPMCTGCAFESPVVSDLAATVDWDAPAAATTRARWAQYLLSPTMRDIVGPLARHAAPAVQELIRLLAPRYPAELGLAARLLAYPEAPVACLSGCLLDTGSRLVTRSIGGAMEAAPRELVMADLEEFVLRGVAPATREERATLVRRLGYSTDAVLGPAVVPGANELYAEGPADTATPTFAGR